MQSNTREDSYVISRAIKGCWQMSSGHGGYPGIECALRDMAAFEAGGVVTFDCADIYTGVEAILGEYRKMRPSDVPRMRVHTKFVPDLDVLPCINKRYVERIIDRSLQRLGVERLDLVQFHWWDFSIPGHVDTAQHLAELQKAGKIEFVGVTNYDTEHLAELVNGGVPIITNQVQYSVLDGRPAYSMARFCIENSIQLLCYGTAAGGFLTDQFFRTSAPNDNLSNRSLTKYKLVIDDSGGWDWFQNVLEVLHGIAVRHDVGIMEVAASFVLRQTAVSSLIFGGSAKRIKDIHRSLSLRLRDDDMHEIRMAIGELPRLPGDVYSVERIKGGKHAQIMRYDLNAA